jgi:hypothetical protein
MRKIMIITVIIMITIIIIIKFDCLILTFTVYFFLTLKVIQKQEDFRLKEDIELENEDDLPNVFTEEKKLVKLPLITSKWKIGEREKYNAPVGFAKNPKLYFNSLGNEIYYAYDGDWKDGEMNGYGSYVYSDGLRLR